MPRGVPKSGFRMTRKRQAVNFATQAVKPVRTETVAEIESKLADRFEALAIMSEATGKGINRSLIVSGPAGLGKSFTVEAKLTELEQKGHSVTYIKGYVRPLALYKLLYETRHPNSVLVFDDSDSVFYDDVSMNLLKGACDSTERRVLHWLSKSIEKEEDEEGESIPEKFEFQGSIIFITNYDFDAMIESGNKLAPHFQALVSRSHYLDLAMKTKMDYIVRIRQVVRGGMLRDRGFNAAEQTMILEFIENNMERLRELSLRMVVKISGLYKMDKSNWQKLAKQTCFRNAA
jgi:Cdc6-like AAA superfamily ATPase